MQIIGQVDIGLPGAVSCCSLYLRSYIVHMIIELQGISCSHTVALWQTASMTYDVL